MDENVRMVKGLLLIGPARYTIPALAIVGATGIVVTSGYGVYKLIKHTIKPTKEHRPKIIRYIPASERED